MSDLIRFLSAIWRFQPTGSRFLSSKDFQTGDWSEYPVSDKGPAQRALSAPDLYFCPNTFTEPRRLRKYANPGRWLYADLDEVDPRTLTDVLPTLAWETSPGRYQAAWLLDRLMSPRRLEQLNQRLTYFTGADKGGWSLTKVLRVPGSVSTKHGTPFTVRQVKLPSERPKLHQVEDLSTLLRDVSVVGGTTKVPGVPAESDLPEFSSVWRRRRRSLPSRAKTLIRTKTAVSSDDRSARLWELENLLIDAGLKPIEVLVLVRATPWNKFAGMRRELATLWTEIHKVIANGQAPPVAKAKTTKRSTPTGLLPNTLHYDDFMNREWPKPSWLIDGCWTEGAYGILAGEYKAFKTMVLLDMALSVASGQPFLGKYAVNKPGGVCYIHEEGRPWSIHDRMSRIAHGKGLTDRYDPEAKEIVFEGRSLPIHITSLPKITLTDDDDQVATAKHVEALKPRLVIFETFYLLSGGASETALEEVSPMLEFLAHLSHTYGTAVILSHHFHKSKEDKRFLDRVSGSNIFLRWYESGLFIERTGEEETNTITMLSSHRDGASSRDTMRLIWDSEDDGTSYLIEHLDDNEETRADNDAATTILDLGGAKKPDWMDAFSDLEVSRMVHRISAITAPTPLTELKTMLGLSRTEQVASLVKKITGVKVATIDGVRVVTPS